MTDKTNRRELIIHTAADLFVQHGYEGTSVRQIAEQVGVTEAALYYHFKEGKRELLQAVVECNLPDLMNIVDACNEATTLRDVILTFCSGMAKIGSVRIHKYRWIWSEFHLFSAEEKAMIHTKHKTLHTGLAAQIERFIHNQEKAYQLAWMTVCGMFGYAHIFWNLDVQSISNFKPDMLGVLLADAVEKAALD